MADQFDLCECINLLTQEQRMQRLINMLRDSQTVCNDNECFTEGLSGPSTAGVVAPGDEGTQLSLLTLMIGWIVIAIILFVLRPSSWRRHSSNKKQPNGGQGGDGDREDRDPNRDRFVL